MKVPCIKNLYYHRKLDNNWWALLAESTASKDKTVALAFKEGRDYEMLISTHSLSYGVGFINASAVGEDGRTHTLFSSGLSLTPTFFNFDEVKELSKGRHRLNITLDAESFAKLEKIKKFHNDPSYTQAIKRALATQKFIDDEMDNGKKLFVGLAEKGEIERVILPG